MAFQFQALSQGPGLAAAAATLSAAPFPTTPQPIFTSAPLPPPNCDSYHIDAADHEAGLPTANQFQRRLRGCNYYCRIHLFNSNHASSSCPGSQPRPAWASSSQPPPGGSPYYAAPTALVSQAPHPAPYTPPLHAPSQPFYPPPVQQYSGPQHAYHAAPPPNPAGGDQGWRNQRPYNGYCEHCWGSHSTSDCKAKAFERDLRKWYNVRKTALYGPQPPQPRPPRQQQQRPPPAAPALAAAMPATAPATTVAAAAASSGAAASGGIAAAVPHSGWQGRPESFTVHINSYYNAEYEYGEGFLETHANITLGQGEMGIAGGVKGAAAMSARVQVADGEETGVMGGPGLGAAPLPSGSSCGVGENVCVSGGQGEAADAGGSSVAPGDSVGREAEGPVAPAAAVSDARDPLPVSFEAARAPPPKPTLPPVGRAAVKLPSLPAESGAGSDWEVEITVRRARVPLRDVVQLLGSGSFDLMAVDGREASGNPGGADQGQGSSGPAATASYSFSPITCKGSEVVAAACKAVPSVVKALEDGSESRAGGDTPYASGDLVPISCMKLAAYNAARAAAPPVAKALDEGRDSFSLDPGDTTNLAGGHSLPDDVRYHAFPRGPSAPGAPFAELSLPEASACCGSTGIEADELNVDATDAAYECYTFGSCGATAAAYTAGSANEAAFTAAAAPKTAGTTIGAAASSAANTAGLANAAGGATCAAAIAAVAAASSAVSELATTPASPPCFPASFTSIDASNAATLGGSSSRLAPFAAHPAAASAPQDPNPPLPRAAATSPAGPPTASPLLAAASLPPRSSWMPVGPSPVTR